MLSLITAFTKCLFLILLVSFWPCLLNCLSKTFPSSYLACHFHPEHTVRLDIRGKGKTSIPWVQAPGDYFFFHRFLPGSAPRYTSMGLFMPMLMCGRPRL